MYQMSYWCLRKSAKLHIDSPSSSYNGKTEGIVSTSPVAGGLKPGSPNMPEKSLFACSPAAACDGVPGRGCGETDGVGRLARLGPGQGRPVAIRRATAVHTTMIPP